MTEKTTPALIRPAPDLGVAIWLGLVCLCVIAMIVVGGATRLTDSGLSITEWDLGKGLVPPLTEAGWLQELELYRRTTEYQQLNRGMELSEFQFIYWWEWSHRFLGKFVGVVFAVPFLVFALSGRLRGRLGVCLTLFALGGLQGAIGWWMVTSGLYGRLDVSPIRLATHLGMAFLILGLGTWAALSAAGWPKTGGRSGVATPLLVGFQALLFLQILMGALVAGKDAGPMFSDWPTMAGRWFPDNYLLLDPPLRNLWENVVAVHFNHRLGGYLVALAALGIGLRAFLAGAGATRGVALALAGVALAQMALGVVVVMTGAPLSVSLIHQFGAVVLWVTGAALLRAHVGREPVTAQKDNMKQGFAAGA